MGIVFLSLNNRDCFLIFFIFFFLFFLLLIVQAPLSSEESAVGVLSVIGGLTEKDHGSFLDHTGATVPW